MPPPTTPDDELPHGIARFWSEDGQVTGTGFLIAERTLCTCAHVVASALGVGECSPQPPSSPVTLDFPLLSQPSARLRATVTHWRPVTADGGGDIALLALEEAVPGTAAVRFAGGTAVWDHAFRVLGFPLRTDDHGVWVDGRLRAPVGKGWTSMEARPVPGGPAIGRGFSGGPVWDADQGGVVGMTVAAETGTGATTAYLIPAALLLGLEPGLRSSPFRGLESFREQDAAVFFARRTDSERIVRAVGEQTFVPVAGASGVGKSSLVRAGALPLLRAAGYTVTDFVGQPGAAPVRVLSAALREQFPDVRALRDLDGRITQETAILIGAGLLAHSGPAGHVIVLDQFEETVGAEPGRARDLLDTLLTMASARLPDGRRLRVLTTLRSASLEDLVAAGDAERLSVTVQMLAPMTRDQLAEIVRRPLESIPGVDFEPGLAERIVTDAGSGPGALPLVQFVLSRLWDRAERGRLTHDAYRELGGVDGALACYADHQLKEVCGALGGPGVEVARHLFEQLVLPDGGQGFVRVARAYDSLSPQHRATAQALASTRLLVLARDSAGRETVALAHESLVRQWPTLREWLEDSRGFRVWQERLRARMRDWEDGERHSDLLLRGQEFTSAQERVRAHAQELDAAEAEFVELSRRQHRRVVRRGRAVAAVVVVLTLVAGLLVHFVRQADNRAELRDEREAADSLAAEAAKKYNDPVAAAVTAVRAFRTARTDETFKALLPMYAPMSSLAVVDGDFLAGRVLDAASSADGSRVALLYRDDDNVLRAYLVTDLFRAVPVKVEISKVPSHAHLVAVSDDGSRVGVAGTDGKVTVWSADALDEPLDHWRWTVPATAYSDRGVLDFSADGRHLLHVIESDGCPTETQLDSHLYLRAIDDQRRESLPSGVLPADTCLDSAALPAGDDASDFLITVGSETSVDASTYAVRISRLGTGEKVWARTHLDLVDIGPGGRALGVLAAGKVDGSYRDPATGAELKGVGPFQGTDLTDETGRFAVMIAGQLTVWHHLANGRVYIAPLFDAMSSEDPQTFLFAADGPDGPRLRVLSGSRLIEMREARGPSPMWGGRGEVSASFSASGRRLVAVLSESDSYSSTWRHTLAFLGGRRPVLATLGLGEGPGAAPSLTVSGDGRRAVVWWSRGWALYRLVSGKVTRVEGESLPAGTAVGETLVRDVQPLGGGDFLILGRDGVQRLDGAMGERASSPGSGCDESDSGSLDYCVALAVAPGEGLAALTLQNDGTARSWSLVDGSPGPVKDLGEGSSSGSGSVRYRGDGRRVAVAVGDEVVVWDLGADHVEELDVGYTAEIAAFDEEGGLVLRDRNAHRGEVELWSEHDRRLLVSFDGPNSQAAWRLDGGAVYNGTEWGTWEIPLQQSALAEALCRAIGAYDPPVLRTDLPPAAYTKPPCPGSPR